MEFLHSSVFPCSFLNPGHSLTQVDSELSQISIKLTGETEGSGDTAHDNGDQVVQVTVAGGSELQGAEADIVQSLVIDTEGLVRVLDQLVNGEGGIVGLDDGVRDLRVVEIRI